MSKRNFTIYKDEKGKTFSKWDDMKCIFATATGKLIEIYHGEADTFLEMRRVKRQFNN